VPEKPVENTDEVIFTNTSKGENQTEWTWYFADHNSTKQKGQTARYLFKEAGNYPVVLLVKNMWGCSDTTIKSMRIEEDFNVFIPNAFTPNGDELNDVFIPVVRGVKFYTLSVFDRWGNLIFEKSELNKGWDGTYKDVASKQDVYVWKMTVSSKSGEQKTLTGQVTLTR
jgi:gliding motility-associated-like protein